jgi:Zyg-11 family protein
MRNMMGLLGNVAEVKELRPRLMQPNFISEFSELLFSTQDGIEVFITIFTCRM